MPHSIIVYLLTNDPKCESVKNLSQLFTSNIFTIKIINDSLCKDGKDKESKDANTDINTDDTTEHYLQLEESFRVNHCLTDSNQKHPKSYILILKDTSVTHANAEIIEEIIKKTLDTVKFHLCYLCKWLDRCDLYTNKKEIRGKTSILVKTQAPHGIQALLISPEGRSILLGDKQMKNGRKLLPGFSKEKGLSFNLTEFIVKGYLDATCVVPNLFDFDISKASKNSDYYKSMECMPMQVDKFGVPPGTISNKIASYIVLFILILLIIMGIFFVVAK